MKLSAPKEPKQMAGRVLVVGAIFVMGLFLLAFNLYRLMVVRYPEFLALSIDNEFKDVRIRSSRGLIRDRRGEVLVDARPSLDVFLTPAFCVKCQDEVLPKLGQWLEWDDAQKEKISAMLREARGPQRYQQMVLQVDLNRDQFDLLRSHQAQLPGVDLEPVPHRAYRAGTALAHVLGYMNEVTLDELTKLNAAGSQSVPIQTSESAGENASATQSLSASVQNPTLPIESVKARSPDASRPPYAMGDYTGRRGIERSFENLLRGQDGWVKQVVNARGELMRDQHGNPLQRDEVPPTAGRNVVLSIDARLQAEAERVFPGSAGSIVAIESKTGFVVAMVSRPSFDPNEMTGRVSAQRLQQLSQDPLQPMIFRAGAEHYHPGSTFKVVTLLAGLQAGAVTEDSVATCGGGYQLGNRRWRCHKDSGHGTVRARQAMQVSCDTYFYRLADILGLDPIAAMGKALGLGHITNFGVVGETPGVMPDSEYAKKIYGAYTKGMALNSAIGQGDVNVTPLQLALLYSAIANGGSLYQPQIVLQTESPDGKDVQRFEPVLAHKIEITPAHETLMLDALGAVVNEPGGTAYRARLEEPKMGGKTGTAQVAKLGKDRIKKDQMDYWARDHAWFAAFAPLNDAELTIVVLNEHGGHGGSDAAPAATALFKKYFELKKIDGNAFATPLQNPASTLQASETKRNRPIALGAPSKPTLENDPTATDASSVDAGASLASGVTP
jgi:penicillin-binding protein 2